MVLMEMFMVRMFMVGMDMMMGVVTRVTVVFEVMFVVEVVRVRVNKQDQYMFRFLVMMMLPYFF